MQEEKLIQHFNKTPKRLDKLFFRCNYLWEIFPELSQFLKTIVKPEIKGLRVGGAYIDNDVEVGEGTIIEHGVMIKGPAIIGKGCEIRAGAYIRGGVYVGDNSVIGHCTELKNTIVMNESHLGHFNYAGDSIIGNKVNLGAGAILANLRFDKKEIWIGEISTGLTKFGSILGDSCQLGCHTVLNPGTIFKKDIIYAGKSLKSGIWDKEKIKVFLSK